MPYHAFVERSTGHGQVTNVRTNDDPVSPLMPAYWPSRRAPDSLADPPFLN